MSCFLWRIDIEGNQQITRGQICRYLETVHIENGTRISVIDCKELAAMLRKQFDAFTWVSVKQEMCIRDRHKRKQPGRLLAWRRIKKLCRVDCNL